VSSLSGRVAFLAGGGGGIGTATALCLAAAGAAVAIADIDHIVAEGAAAAVAAAGGRAIALHMDLTQDAQVSAAIAAAVQAFGRLDILFNAAGGTPEGDGPVTEVALEVFERGINVDLRGTFLCCRHAIPQMQAQGHGAIINMSSGAALRGASPFHVYSAAKGAIISLTRALAGHYAKDGIRVNAIASGRVQTERVIKRWGTREDFAKSDDPQSPAARLREYPFWVGEPEHIAQTVLFLASDASRMITGATIPADGGRSAY